MGWKIDDGRPIWTQLKEQMIKRIVSGTYSSGEKYQVSGILQEKQG